MLLFRTTWMAAVTSGWLLLASAAAAQVPMPTSAMREMHFSHVVELLENGDSLRAFDYVEQQGGPLEVAQLYADIARRFHLQRKDTPRSVLFARAGIQYALGHARSVQNTDPELSKHLKATAKAMAYNLGADTWPGWDEPGIELSHSDLVVGMDMARLNLRLAQELDRGPDALGNAYWLLGAHQLAAGQYAEAEQSFARAAGQFQQAQQRELELMAQGYTALALLLQTATQAEGNRRFEETLAALKTLGSDDARYFHEQLGTARRVFQAAQSSASCRSNDKQDER